MPVINLLNQSAPTKSTDQNAAICENMYLVEDTDQGKYQIAAYPTPGLTIFSTIANPVRAIFNEHGVVYAVGGNTFYSIASNGTTTNLGTLNTSSGFCKITGINKELLIIDSSNGYSFNISTSTFAQITSTTYVSSLDITNPGSNYSNPTITINDSTGTGATATATVTNGQIAAVLLTANGSGYTAPTVSITDATGSGAAITAFTTTSSFPTSLLDSVCQDEWGVVLLPNSQEFQSSDISDLTTWPALNFASTTGNQNNNVAITSLHRELWIFQQQTTEVWDNLGTANFTFGRNTSVYLEWGCAATQSVAKGNNTLYWLGQSPSGGYVVLQASGYTPQVISTPGINYQISTYSTVSDAIGFVYQQEGHEFYVLTFPTAGKTWVYDVSTQLWADRTSLVSSSYNQWLPNCYTFCYNKQLVGDYNSGNIYQLDMTVFQEGGSVPIQRTIETHPFYQAGAWMFVPRLQIDFDQTPGSTLSQINLYVSRDGGNTFGPAKPAIPVQDPNGQWRCYWTRLGKAKTFVFKIQTTMNAKFIILGAWATVVLGED